MSGVKAPPGHWERGGVTRRRVVSVAAPRHVNVKLQRRTSFSEKRKEKLRTFCYSTYSTRGLSLDNWIIVFIFVLLGGIPQGSAIEPPFISLNSFRFKIRKFTLHTTADLAEPYHLQVLTLSRYHGTSVLQYQLLTCWTIYLRSCRGHIKAKPQYLFYIARYKIEINKTVKWGHTKGNGLKNLNDTTRCA